MRYLGLIVAVVLIICAFTYFNSRPSVDPGVEGTERYTSAINAARGASKIVDADARRKWAVAQQADSDDLAFSVEGENAEVLTIASDSMDGLRCTRFSVSQQAEIAAARGFTDLVCMNKSNGAEYEVPLTPLKR
jgi:hypothetical protein